MKPTEILQQLLDILNQDDKWPEGTELTIDLRVNPEQNLKIMADMPVKPDFQGKIMHKEFFKIKYIITEDK